MLQAVLFRYQVSSPRTASAKARALRIASLISNKKEVYANGKRLSDLIFTRTDAFYLTRSRNRFCFRLAVFDDGDAKRLSFRVFHSVDIVRKRHGKVNKALSQSKNDNHLVLLVLNTQKTRRSFPLSISLYATKREWRLSPSKGISWQHC